MNSAMNLSAIEAIVIGASASGVEALLNIHGPLREGIGRLLVELERIAC
jgi:two-component system chemotaxis response regulator CheB